MRSFYKTRHANSSDLVVNGKIPIRIFIFEWYDLGFYCLLRLVCKEMVHIV